MAPPKCTLCGRFRPDYGEKPGMFAPGPAGFGWNLEISGTGGDRSMLSHVSSTWTQQRRNRRAMNFEERHSMTIVSLHRPGAFRSTGRSGGPGEISERNLRICDNKDIAPGRDDHG